jgi:hypothetical protein
VWLDKSSLVLLRFVARSSRAQARNRSSTAAATTVLVPLLRRTNPRTIGAVGAATDGGNAPEASPEKSYGAQSTTSESVCAPAGSALKSLRKRTLVNPAHKSKPRSSWG